MIHRDFLVSGAMHDEWNGTKRANGRSLCLYDFYCEFGKKVSFHKTNAPIIHY